MYSNARNKMLELAKHLHIEASTIHAKSEIETDSLEILNMQAQCNKILDIIEGIVACIDILDKENK